MPQQTYEFSNLSTFPELIEQTNLLIETAFGYQNGHKYAADFAPMSGEHNSQHRHILFDPATKEVVAHIGCLPRNFCWNGEVIPVILIGGIAVSESSRGQGLFREMFIRVLSLYHSQCAFFLLWSDKHEMYAKYDFYLAGRQWCYRAPHGNNLGIRSSMSTISQETLDSMNELYVRTVNQKTFSPLRDKEDWSHIKEITSTELYLLEKNETLQGYYFRNKGMDLEGIVHDWAHEDGVTGLLRDSGNPGVIWAAENAPVDDDVLQDLQLVGLWRPNTHVMALKKISILLEGAEVRWKEPYFIVKTQNGSYNLTAPDLLEEIFGHGKYGIRSSQLPVWVGGLDSV